MEATTQPLHVMPFVLLRSGRQAAGCGPRCGPRALAARSPHVCVKLSVHLDRQVGSPSYLAFAEIPLRSSTRLAAAERAKCAAYVLHWDPRNRIQFHATRCLPLTLRLGCFPH